MSTDLAARVSELEKTIAVLSATPTMKRALSEARLITRIREDAETRAALLQLAPKERLARLKAMAPIDRGRIVECFKLGQWADSCRGLPRRDREFIISIAPRPIHDQIRVELLDAKDLPDLVQVKIGNVPASATHVVVPTCRWRDADDREREDVEWKVDRTFVLYLLRAELDDRLGRDKDLAEAIANGQIVVEPILDERALRDWLYDQVQRGAIQLLRPEGA